MTSPQVDMIAIRTEAVTEQRGYASLLAFAQDFPMRTEDDFSTALDMVREVKARAKSLDDKRRSLTDPLKDVIKQIEAEIRPRLDLAKEIEHVLKAKAAAYRAAAARTQAAAFEVAQQAIAAAAPVEQQRAALAVAQAATPPTAAGASFRSTWRARVVDGDAVPREFWQIDIAALDKIGRESKGRAIVPGVVWEEVPIVTVRS